MKFIECSGNSWNSLNVVETHGNSLNVVEIHEN